MKLFLISQSANENYDTYDSAVVAANSPEEAALIHPGRGVWNGEEYVKRDESTIIVDTGMYSWTTPDKVTAIQIGTTEDFQSGDVICASFNAG